VEERKMERCCGLISGYTAGMVSRIYCGLIWGYTAKVAGFAAEERLDKLSKTKGYCS
jgi:hypothetical protein